ncbi:MAG: hypothetical protein ABSC21_11450 [Terriglobia bacterium]|jgi:hypothetical protein
MCKGRLRIPSASVGFVHEYAFTEQGRLMHRFVDEEGNPTLDHMGEFTAAPDHQAEHLVHYFRARLKGLCAESEVDFEKFTSPFLQPNPRRKR